MCSLPAHSLSATTAQTIAGTEPYLLLSDGVTKLTNLDELLGFSMPNRDGTTEPEIMDTSMVDMVIAAPSGMKYQDVVTLIPADGSAHNVAGVIVGDDDGDASLAANTSVIGKMKATWYDGAGKQVTNLNQKLSNCRGLYNTLKIEIPVAVSANTSYGAPNSKSYGTHAGVTYTFAGSPGICYLQPEEMTINTGANVKYAAGYNLDVWEYDSATSTHKGFKANSGFPTTGFNRAVFSVIGSGNDQSKYRCSSSDDGGKIILSGAASSSLGAKCQVTYNVGTRAAFTAGGTPTINMEYNNSGTWIQIDSYTIPTPVLWALPQSGTYKYGNSSSLATSTIFPALDRCRVVIDGSASPATTWQQAAGQTAADRAFRQTYMYRRDELTNSPFADRTVYPEGSAPLIFPNYFSRDVDGTFMGEWGYVYSYSGSGWDSFNRYWPSEVSSSDDPFNVYTNGYVRPLNPDNALVTVCRD